MTKTEKVRAIKQVAHKKIEHRVPLEIIYEVSKQGERLSCIK